VHKGTYSTAEQDEIGSKTECMIIPGARRVYSEFDTSKIHVGGNHFISFTEKFDYLGSTVHYTLRPDEDIKKRLNDAAKAFGALKKVLTSGKIQAKTRGKIYVTAIVTILLYGSEVWPIRSHLMRMVRNFHRRCVRQMTHVGLRKQRRHRINTKQLEAKLGIHDIDKYYVCKTLDWMQNIALMPDCRLPKKFLTCWIDAKRPVGRPKQNLGHTYKRILQTCGISSHYGTWTELAKDKPEWDRIAKDFANSQSQLYKI
jgi:hypothetical protein